MIATCAGVNTLGSTARLVLSSIVVAWISSRSLRVNTRSGIGVSQMSASRPTWWLACPVSIGPPRGCEMSPTSKPGPAVLLAFPRRSASAGDELGMAPGAIARQAHRLPVGAGVGEVHAAGRGSPWSTSRGRAARARPRSASCRTASRARTFGFSFPSCRRPFVSLPLAAGSGGLLRGAGAGGRRRRRGACASTSERAREP